MFGITANSQRGFGLIEVVITVGLLLITSVAGLTGYQAVENMRQMGVKAYAATVRNEAIQADMGFDESITIGTVEAAANAREGGYSVSISRTADWRNGGICVVATSSSTGASASAGCRVSVPAG